MTKRKMRRRLGNKAMEWETIGKIILVLFMLLIALILFMKFTGKSFDLLDFIFGN